MIDVRASTISKNNRFYVHATAAGREILYNWYNTKPKCQFSITIHAAQFGEYVIGN